MRPTAHCFNGDRPIHHFFEKQASLTPDTTAVLSEAGNYTYKDLNALSNQIAHLLLKSGLQKADIVAVKFQRSVQMLASVLAVLKIGAAYLPVDPRCPHERLELILQKSGASALLTEDDMERGSDLQSKMIILSQHDLEQFSCQNVECVVSSDLLAYVIFTSGSTGAPKGVMITHRSVINRLEWMAEAYNISESDVILQKTPYTFDVSVWELFLWFFTKSTLCLYAHGQESNAQMLVEFIDRYQITICHFVPTMLSIFLSFLTHRESASKVKSLKRVFASGEALPPQTVHSFTALLTGPYGAKLHNLYGPTEATVDVTYFDCTDDKEYQGEDVPIGKPIWNTEIYILDDTGAPLASGSLGEIYIAGEGVGRGYINDASATRRAFLDDPFNPGGRMYRTGDAGMIKDGYVLYLGRLDNQIKIRGNRVELEEVENTILRSNLVDQAIVCFISDEDRQYLAAFYTGGKTVEREEFETFLRQHIPEYMVPRTFKRISEFPFTQSGKVDRRELAKLEKHSESKPSSLKIIDQISSVLGEPLSEAQMEADLPSAGIDSITYVKVIITLEQFFHIQFDREKLIPDVFPSLGALVLYVEEKISVSAG